MVDAGYAISEILGLNTKVVCTGAAMHDIGHNTISHEGEGVVEKILNKYCNFLDGEALRYINSINGHLENGFDYSTKFSHEILSELIVRKEIAGNSEYSYEEMDNVLDLIANHGFNCKVVQRKHN